MKLHELVRLRNVLDDTIKLDELKSLTEELLHRIDAVSVDAPGSGKNYATELTKVRRYYAIMLTLLDTPPKELAQIHNNIDAQISRITENWNKRGYTINGQFASGSSDVDGERIDRATNLSNEVKSIVRARTDLYSDWHYPGMELGPGDGMWTPFLVANDPLYLVDVHKEFLDSTVSQFPEQYQNRLRKYNVNTDGVTIKHLPKSQLGFVFAWNVFTFFPYEETKDYLTEIFKLLRPGGVFLFSYNNCDQVLNAKMAEEGYMSWMPKRTLKELVLSLGYEIIEFFDIDGHISWVEVKKPGTRSTIKAHQVLGEIHTKGS